MTIQSDKWIKFQAGMISPIVNNQNRFVNENPVVSYGVTSYGYDIRLAPELKLFDKYSDKIIDPKRFDEKILVDLEIQKDHKGSEFFILPAYGFALGRSVESFDIPREVLVVCVGKSTYARCGLNVLVTPLEPNWRGQITLEFSNNTPLPCMLYVNEGITQLLFFKGHEECEVSYSDRNGKYQDQKGITLPK
jgi:dCTP deaminase